MPKGLVRIQKCGVFHFITFSCYRRRPLLAQGQGYSAFERELEAVRKNYGFVVAGYVLMPEHVHLLVGEPVNSSLAVVLQVLKQRTSRRLKMEGLQFWQRRYYDFNVWSDEKRIEKLRYMHRNPVKRGLGRSPKTGPGRVFATTLSEIKDPWRSSRSGPREDAGRSWQRSPDDHESRDPTLREEREGWGTHLCCESAENDEEVHQGWCPTQHH